MKARLSRITNPDDGLAVLTMDDGGELCAVDRLARGPSSQPLPTVGVDFTPSFSYQLKEAPEPRLLPEGEGAALVLERTGPCAYRAVARVLSIDAIIDARVQVAKVQCGACVLPAPMDLDDPLLVGRLVSFEIEQLEVWRA